MPSCMAEAWQPRPLRPGTLAFHACRTLTATRAGLTTHGQTHKQQHCAKAGPLTRKTCKIGKMWKTKVPMSPWAVFRAEHAICHPCLEVNPSAPNKGGTAAKTPTKDKATKDNQKRRVRSRKGRAWSSVVEDGRAWSSLGRARGGWSQARSSMGRARVERGGVGVERGRARSSTGRARSRMVERGRARVERGRLESSTVEHGSSAGGRGRARSSTGRAGSSTSHSGVEHGEAWSIMHRGCIERWSRRRRSESSVVKRGRVCSRVEHSLHRQSAHQLLGTNCRQGKKLPDTIPVTRCRHKSTRIGVAPVLPLQCRSASLICTCLTEQMHNGHRFNTA